MSYSNDGNYCFICDVVWEYDWYFNDWWEMICYSVMLFQQVGSGSLLFNGIWSEDVCYYCWCLYQLGYVNCYGQFNYYLYVQQSQDIYYCNNQVVGVFFLLLFGQVGSLIICFNYDKNYGSQLQFSYIGSVGEKNVFSYGLIVSYDMLWENLNEVSVVVNGSLWMDYVYLNVSVSVGCYQQQYLLGVLGVLVVYQGGMIVIFELGEIFVIVEVFGVVGVWVVNCFGQLINCQGFMIIFYFDFFIVNWLDFDLQGLNDYVEIVFSSMMVVFDLGVVVKVKFVMCIGYVWFVYVMLLDGVVFLLGVEVFDDNGWVVGVVGQGGLLYVWVLQDYGSVLVVWGECSG